ncbi:MAG: hypothetical protein P1U65_01475 [Minwuia sp.]|nr:hypothetical protein [Minwuia sp.]
MTLIRIALVFAGLFLANSGINWLDQNVNVNRVYGNALSAHMAKNDLTSEVIFIGDSRTHQGVIPTEFTGAIQERTGRNVPAWNFGRPGMQIPFFYFTIEEFAKASGKWPRAVIMNASYYLLCRKDWMNRVYLPYFELEPEQFDTAADLGVIWPWEKWYWQARQDIPLLGSFHMVNTLFGMLAKSAPVATLNSFESYSKHVYSAYSDELRGYYPRGNIHIGPNDRRKTRTFRDDLACDNFLQFLDKLIVDAKQHGTMVIIYEFPWAKAQESPLDNAMIAYYQTKVKNITKRHENSLFIEYDHFWDYRNFVDTLHLNNRGASKLTNLIAEWYIEEIGIIDN